MSKQETDWLDLRGPKTTAALKDFLGRMNLGSDFQGAAYIDRIKSNSSNLPKLAIAVSGGGYRALMNGAGAIKAFDSRTPGSKESGQLGGLLQSATYVSGLSGGSWLLGSIYVNNFTTIGALQAEDKSNVWEFGNSMLKGPARKGISIFNTATYYDDVVKAVNSKSNAGFMTTVTDYWARGLSYQLINATDGGPSYTWSSIAQDADFASGNAPMPLIVADGRAPNQRIMSSNTTVFEFNPFEFGSFDPTSYGFAQLKYLGSKYFAGVIPPDQMCVEGFDNAGFVMATSSSLFHEFLLNYYDSALPSAARGILGPAIRSILTKFDTGNRDIADYTPNPFRGYDMINNPSANSSRLTLVDGGEDFENIPLQPVIQPLRQVDVILAIDSSADTATYWPNGTSLVATYERAQQETQSIANGTSFPSIPDVNTFVNLGLSSRPTFFGCNSSNTTRPTPLVVYLPNSPYSYHSNVSTFDPAYNNTVRDAIILNGYNIATLGNGTLDSAWGTCLSCAILSRSFERTNTPVPAACKSCFTRYCWDGRTDPSTPKPFNPDYKLKPDQITKVDGPAPSGSSSPSGSPKTSDATRTVNIPSILALAPAWNSVWRSILASFC